jgi:hypothetical protein
LALIGLAVGVLFVYSAVSGKSPAAVLRAGRKKK